MSPTVAQKLRSIAAPFHQALDGIRLLNQAQLAQPCLIVIYSTIDSVASLAADHEGDVTQEDFVTWVDQFMLPGSKLTCSAIDLYAARCGVLHSFSANSSLHRRGRARAIYYAWGDTTASKLESLLHSIDSKEAVAIHITDLQDAILAGWNRFADSLNARPEAVDQMLRRGEQVFGMVSKETVEKAMRGARGANG